MLGLLEHCLRVAWRWLVATVRIVLAVVGTVWRWLWPFFLALSYESAVSATMMLSDLAAAAWILIERNTGLADLITLPIQAFHFVSAHLREAVRLHFEYWRLPIPVFLQQPLCVAFFALTKGWGAGRKIYRTKREKLSREFAEDAATYAATYEELDHPQKRRAERWLRLVPIVHAVSSGTKLAAILVGSLAALHIIDLVFYQRRFDPPVLSEVSIFSSLFLTTVLLAAYSPWLRNAVSRSFDRFRSAMTDPFYAAGVDDDGDVENIREYRRREASDGDSFQTRPASADGPVSFIVQCQRCRTRVRLDPARSGRPKCPRCGSSLPDHNNRRAAA